MQTVTHIDLRLAGPTSWLHVKSLLGGESTQAGAGRGAGAAAVTAGVGAGVPAGEVPGGQRLQVAAQ